MSQTVAAHQATPVTDPQNGQTPIDADQVRANDNATITVTNAHDADTGVHVQSSVLASRPAFGTAGRKWWASDTGQLFFDTAAAWSEVNYLNKTAGGTVVGATTFSGGMIGDVTGNLTGNVTGNVTGDVTGNVSGNAGTATILATTRAIALGGVLSGSANFNGSAGITITAAIVAGSIVNADINASAAIVDTKLATIATAGKVSNSATTATASGTINAIVLRDGSGNFAASNITLSGSINVRGVTYVWPTGSGLGALTNDGTGNLTWSTSGGSGIGGGGTQNNYARFASGGGDVQDGVLSDNGTTLSSSLPISASTFTGALSGNASTATALATARAINGVNFDGTGPITVTAAADTLSGSTLAAGVTASSLTSVGTLGSLGVTGTVTAGLFSGSGASLTSLNGSDVSSGTVAPARLGSGTPDSTTFLRGDGAWVVPTAGGDMTYVGDWLISTHYVVGNVVTHNSGSYVATNSSTGSEPPSADWTQLGAY